MHDFVSLLPAVLYEYAIFKDGRKSFQYVSSNSKTILGLSAEAIMQDYKLLDSIIHEDDLPYLKDTAIESHQNQDEWHWQGRIVVDSKVKWVEFRSNHELKSDGTIIRRGIIQDITTRKETAKESEIRYQALVEKLPIGIVIHKQGKLLFANSQAHIILGVKKSRDLIETSVLDFVHPDYRESIIRRIKEIESGVPTPMMEQKFIRRDGRVVDVETMAFPFSFKGELAIQVIFRDITEKKTN